MAGGAKFHDSCHSGSGSGYGTMVRLFNYMLTLNIKDIWDFKIWNYGEILQLILTLNIKDICIHGKNEGCF